jgi:putative pyruvate formate lyase activating enzyme
MPETVYLARAALHHWEEPPISGTRGAGTVFFSGCNLGCVFCQNDVISRQRLGKPVTEQRLREIFGELVAQGAHNIDLVSPTHSAHVLSRVLSEPLPVPVVWNTGGYEKVETLRALEGKVDVYLPDLKYLDRDPAQRYSGAADYPERAKAAILEMVRQTGPVQLDEEGIIRKGVIIRHLILPGQVSAAKAVMDWVAETFPRGTVLFSLMSQYVPLGRAAEFKEIDRVLRKGEARSAAAYMANLGLQGFTQELGAADAQYVPSFDFTGL